MVRKLHGFTMAELLIVVAVIGLMFAATGFNWYTQVKRGYDVRRKTDLSVIKKAMEAYYNDHNCYPPKAQWDSYNCTTNSSEPVDSVNFYEEYKSYMDNHPIPCDPLSRTPYYYLTITDVNGGACGGYRLFSALDDKSDPGIVAVGCNPTNGCGYDAPAKYNYGISSDIVGLAPSVAPDVSAPAGITSTPAVCGPSTAGILFCTRGANDCQGMSGRQHNGQSCSSYLMASPQNCKGFTLSCAVTCQTLCTNEKAQYECLATDNCY